MTNVKAELVGNNIWVDVDSVAAPFKQRLAAVKSVRGAKWNKSKKKWVYPLAWEVCLEIRTKIADHLGVDLDIGPELTKWAYAEKERRERVPSVKSMERVELPEVQSTSPTLHLALQNRPFQTVGVAFGAHNRHCLLGDEPGLGKTLQAIGSAMEAGLRGPILVVAPKTAGLVTWTHELAQWAPNDRVVVLSKLAEYPAKGKARKVVHFAYEDGKIAKDSYTGKPIIDHVEEVVEPSPREQFLEDAFKVTEHERTWYIVSPHWVRIKAELDARGNYARDEDGNKKITANLPELFDVEWQAVYVDESHEVLICNTANKKKHTSQRLGMGALNISSKGIRMAMSGTPGRGKQQNMWGTLNWLRPDLYSSYWKWIERHFHMYTADDGYGTVEIGTVKDEKAFYAELAEVFLRRTKLEVAADLPSKLYGGTYLTPTDDTSPIGVWLPMTPKQQRMYDQMTKEGAAEVDGGSVIANGILSEWTRLRQFSDAPQKMVGGELWPVPKDSNKFEWLVEFLDERGITGKKDEFGDGKVVIASQFSKIVDGFVEELESMGIACHKLTGATKPDERQRIQKEFQAPGGPRVFFLSTKAGGVSLTLDAADDVVILDETFIPDDQLQVEDRAHRLSRPDHQVSIWYVRSLGGIEEAIAATTMGREENMRAIMDGARGVDIRRQILEYTPRSAA